MSADTPGEASRLTELTELTSRRHLIGYLAVGTLGAVATYWLYLMANRPPRCADREPIPCPVDVLPASWWEPIVLVGVAGVVTTSFAVVVTAGYSWARRTFRRCRL